MPFSGQSQTEEIKSRLDVAEVIRQYVRIEKAGINYRGLCPFHKEKSPSFFVSPTRQIWRCFGCSEGGDAFSFVMKIEGVDFSEALRMLAARAGVTLHYEDVAQRSIRIRLIDACAAAADFFQEQFRSQEAETIRAYINSRGLTQDSVKDFRIGYSPEQPNALTSYLRSRQFTDREIMTAGLALSGNGGGPRDRFRGRIIFPITNIQGQVIAFGGRITEKEKKYFEDRGQHAAKYINSPETPIYSKSNVLYGLDKAKLALREQDACIVVEGYTDVIMTHQAGYKNVVASSGTALTERQLDLMQRYTNNLFTSFDMDVAGDTATKRGIDLAQKKGFNIRVITFVGAKDPADIIRDTPSIWGEGVKNAQSIAEFYFSNTLARHDARVPEQKIKIAAILLPIILHMPSRIEQSHWVSRLADTLRVNEQDVWIELERTQRAEAHKQERAALASPKPLAEAGSAQGYGEAIPGSAQGFGVAKKDRAHYLKERIFALLVSYPDLQSQFNKDMLRLLPNGEMAAIGDVHPLDEMLVEIAKSDTLLNDADLRIRLSAEHANYADHLFFQNEVFAQDTDKYQTEFQDLLKEWKRDVIRIRLQDLQREIHLQEQQGKASDESVREVGKLTADLATL